nr:phage recombination protein Bet [uncultured Lichenicoccus sp.]
MNAVSRELVTRLPMPPGTNLDVAQWSVLCDAIWPGAKTPEGVRMALDYCRVRKLDPFKRPVHVVTTWNSALRREVETVWPGINELQTTAARTGDWAGMDEPKWGPMTTQTFKGFVGKSGQEREVSATVTFPEWCAVTVWRFIHGQRCAFCEPVYWIEAYGRQGRSVVPNEMWAKRVRGQLHKVAKAASLRAAFPEETGNDYTAEEMAGQQIDAGGVVIDHEPLAETAPEPSASPAPHQAVDHVALIQRKVAACTDADCVVRLGATWASTMERAKAAGRPIAEDVHISVTDLLADALGRFEVSEPDYGEMADETMPA